MVCLSVLKKTLCKVLQLNHTQEWSGNKKNWASYKMKESKEDIVHIVTAKLRMKAVHNLILWPVVWTS